MCGSATNAKWAATKAREKQRMQTGGVAMNADRGATNVDRGVMNADGCNECGQGVQRMWTRGATNADGGATNVMAMMTGATDVDGNECPKTEVRNLCLGVWHAVDSTNKVAAGSARRGS